MEKWFSLKRSFNEGLMMTTMLQQAFMSAYMAHLGAGKGYAREAAIFVRSDAPSDTYEFFVSPQCAEMMYLMLPMMGFTPCEPPPRRTGPGRWDGSLSLIVGEATAWKLFESEPEST